MVVVICPTCKNKAWANVQRPGLPVKDGNRKAYTVCCHGTVVVGEK